MWWKKAYVRPQPAVVECEKCGHIIAKHRSYPVEYVCLYESAVLRYCAACKPAYSKIWARGLHQQYFKEMEVDVSGEPVGYLKA